MWCPGNRSFRFGKSYINFKTVTNTTGDSNGAVQYSHAFLYNSEWQNIMPMNFCTCSSQWKHVTFNSLSNVYSNRKTVSIVLNWIFSPTQNIFQNNTTLCKAYIATYSKCLKTDFISSTKRSWFYFVFKIVHYYWNIVEYSYTYKTYLKSTFCWNAGCRWKSNQVCTGALRALQHVGTVRWRCSDVSSRLSSPHHTIINWRQLLISRNDAIPSHMRAWVASAAASPCHIALEYSTDSNNSTIIIPT